jgi:hypothetical protein
MLNKKESYDSIKKQNIISCPKIAFPDIFKGKKMSKR